MPHKTDWLKDAGWGVFFHYLASPASAVDASPLTVADWNRRVDGFDATAFAGQVAAMGAAYACLTIGQNSGFFCAPNAMYDEIVGISPSKCSRRDLMADVADALALHGIRTIAYLPANAPTQDEEALVKLRFTPPWDASSTGGFNNALCDANTDERLTEFQSNWEAVIREWSVRWGERVSGWWIDGCMFADKMYEHPDAPNFASFASALRTGNAQSLVAFNKGVIEHFPTMAATPEEDYSAGEVWDLLAVCKERWLHIEGKAVQWHTLLYAGEFWGRGGQRFRDDFVHGYTRQITDHGGAVTWDIPVSDRGEIPAAFIRQMQGIHSRQI